MPTLPSFNHAILCACNRSDNETSFSMHFLVQLDLKDPIDNTFEQLPQLSYKMSSQSLFFCVIHKCVLGC